MTSWAGLGWRVWLAVTALTMSAGCELGQSCTLIGCIDQIFGEAEVPAAAAAEHEVTVCVDDRCTSARLPVEDVAGVSRCASLTGPFAARVCIGAPEVLDGGSSLPFRRVDVSIEVSEGRSVRLSVVDPDGVSLLDETRPVRFTRVYPNGEDCDSGCRQASVHF